MNDPAEQEDPEYRGKNELNYRHEETALEKLTETGNE